VALVVHFVLRSFGAYDFDRVLNTLRSSVTAAAAWVLSTAPLLSWSIGLDRTSGFGGALSRIGSWAERSSCLFAWAPAMLAPRFYWRGG